MIAHLGTGLMGAGLARAAMRRGETVHVWNRTPERARPLATEGAQLFTDPAEAVRGAERIHVALSDDASVDAVLEPLADLLDRDTLIFDHTTTAPTLTAERYARWKRRRQFFAHVPMFMGPKNALDATGLMLVSGPRDREQRVRPIIERMTGRLFYVGEGDERAAAFKLFGNMMLVFIVSGMADILAFARGMGITATDAHGLFAEFKPTNSIEIRGKNMAEQNFEPQWELFMARKDVRLMIEEAERHGTALNVLPSIAAFFDRAIEKGHGKEDVAAVVKV